MELGKQYQSEVQSATETLLNTLKNNPEIWSIRKEATRLLFDNGSYRKAADLIWTAPEIPAIDLDIAFAARVLSRAQPRRAIRLLQHVMEKAVGNPAKLLAIANALMHYGMVMQAARFYGAATACDKELANGDLEHFLLWLDDSHRLWGDWEKDDQQMNELPWVRRDQAKDENYEKSMKGLTTPIKVPGLERSSGEHLQNEYYRQVPIRDADPSAPPAVTVPLDQIDPDDAIIDEERGAAGTSWGEVPQKDNKQPRPMVRPEKSEVDMTLPPAPGDSPASSQSEAPKRPVAPGKPVPLAQSADEDQPAKLATPVQAVTPVADDGEAPKVPKIVAEQADEEPKKPKFLF
ncbi:hypothetical protein HW115_07025 [Verrucomicrobiaceae bacterium N1E253]|uniref:Uncharacterized protein n=1 Tax=Oceaniferula marina TaxID=2748318 RepID=A0A851GJT3_9BACT|nr:hypothetical protein [Oceaniferula marina]NWK55357.1 hypothetical protein [Oceaniferula marina]